MGPENDTRISGFLLLGFSEEPELEPFLFGLFLFMYLVTMSGNLLIILATISDSILHTPMYFFLSNLSFVDICLTSTTVPKMLVNIQTQSKVIPYAGCITQMYFFMLFSGLDIFLLTVMAYDRHMAICHPLHYMVIMNPQLCALLSLVSLFLSCVIALLHSLMVLRLSFCTDLEISLFFCDLAQLIKIACSDTLINNIVIKAVAFVFGGVCISGIIASYTQIVFSVLKIPSARGKYKAFSTCGSHFTVVSLFYGSDFGVYFSSAVSDSPRTIAVASMMYTMVPQMVNPFIYSLRNRDMKEALRKLVERKISLL
ncbi:olfactory receptor 7G2 [Tupaia chinensis]|uniref:Olfactory receptor n=1 Tax=Tupaia chinensis TaxID=246437 RepID=L9KW09_TUPCH|nr:olfactory receptor 7G2 [Tupaia chinensis]ELW67110.1 Olfactory receptor 7G1 [Tupaia chinensis]